MHLRRYEWRRHQLLPQSQLAHVWKSEDFASRFVRPMPLSTEESAESDGLVSGREEATRRISHPSATHQPPINHPSATHQPPISHPSAAHQPHISRQSSVRVRAAYHVVVDSGELDGIACCGVAARQCDDRVSRKPEKERWQGFEKAPPPPKGG